MSFDMDESHAKRISESLERCLSMIDETIEFATLNCGAAEAKAYKKAVAAVAADLYMKVLDAGIYQRYPHLRKMPLPITDVVPSGELTPALDLRKVPLLHLLAEALHDGRSNFVPGLMYYEPIDVRLLDEELVRRSGGPSRKRVSDWIEWYLHSDLLSDRERQTLILMDANKRKFDALEEGRD